MLLIRPATENDAALIAEISRETFADTFAAQNTAANMQKFLSEQFSKEMLMAEVGRPSNIFILAIADDIPAGYLFLKEEPGGDSIEIARIYVRRSFIGKTVGKQLMQTAIGYAKNANKTSVWLGVWERNHHAIGFYKSMGFTKYSEQDFILGDDVQNDWLMKRVL